MLQDSLKLFRAVSEAELNDINAFGGFRQEPAGRSLESKQFAESPLDAADFGRDNFRLDQEPFCVVEVETERSIVERSVRLLLDNRPAIDIPKDELPELNATARIRELIAIPIRPK